MTGWSGWVVMTACLMGVFPLNNVQADPCAGPAIQTFDLTLSAGTRTEIAGPFYYRQQRGTELTRAWPPFYSYCENPRLESREDDFLYPLWSRIQYGQEVRWQFTQMLSFGGGTNPPQGDAKRFTIYPLYFQQRSTNGSENYTAVVPFYGHIKNRLLIPDAYFIMFPLYGQTRKHGYVTDNYLWPIFSLRKGDHLEGWKFWPLAGNEHKDITFATNGFGDISAVPGYDKFFYLWPLGFDTKTGLGTENPDHTAGFLPLYTKTRSPQRDSTSVIWPLFSWIDERKRNYHEWQGPWPLVIFAWGEGKHTDRVWPIFSQSHDAKQESDSYLWPLYQYRAFHTDLLETKRNKVLFYIYESTVEHNRRTGTYKKRLDMWPFFEWHKDIYGSTQLQVFAPVEPALNEQRGIERNWSPLWTVWRAQNNATNGCQSRSLLWNLYRSDTTPTSKKSSLLLGLFQYMHDGGTDRLRMFYGLNFNMHKQVKTAGRGKPPADESRHPIN
jgi:hypothetical protein